jgi:hypothetical protein
MNAVVNLITSWPVFLHRAFTEHSLAVAVVTIAAIGIFVVLQREVRPYSLLTNIVYVAVGWLVVVSSLGYGMAALRKAWAVFEGALPLVAKLSNYLYGICERHPVLALVIVGVGTTAFFLKQPWPALVSWAPVRAVCAVFGIALLIHIAGPIADLAAGEPSVLTGQASARPAEQFLDVPPKQAVAQAIKAGDTRYVSVRQCVDEVSGYPTDEKNIASPWTIGVKPLGRSCYESVGHEGSVRMHRYHDYAAQYNRLMYEHNKSVRGPSEQLGYAADGRGIHR